MWQHWRAGIGYGWTRRGKYRPCAREQFLGAEYCPTRVSREFVALPLPSREGGGRLRMLGRGRNLFGVGLGSETLRLCRSLVARRGRGSRERQPGGWSPRVPRRSRGMCTRGRGARGWLGARLTRLRWLVIRGGRGSRGGRSRWPRGFSGGSLLPWGRLKMLAVPA